MKFKTTPLTLFAALILGCVALQPSPLLAADPAPVGKKETLVIGKVKVGDSVKKGSADEGRTNKLDRVSEALDTQFRAALSATRKFQLLAGSDLNSIMDEFKKDPLLSKENPDAHTVGDMVPPKYVVVCSIDDFQDIVQNLNQGGNGDMHARVIRLSVVTTIYKINSGEEFETLNIQEKDRQVVGVNTNVHQSGDALDAILLQLAKQAAQDSAQRVVDVYYPARVLSRVNDSVQINRGDGTTIKVGQLWDAYAQGEELKDPDTGEVLGKQELLVGQVKITSVLPKLSTGDVVKTGPDKGAGIDKGNVLRLHEDKTDAAAPTK